MDQRLVASKWRKQNVLMRNRMVAAHIPESRRFTAANLQAMLARYGSVVLKPIVGTGGVGVIKVSRTGSGWSCKRGFRSMVFSRFPQLVKHLHKLRRGRSYMIQRTIPLAQIAGRPLDYRVKIVKTDGRWRITAMVGRLARPGLFVTNLCQGGTLLRFADGIGRTLGGARVSAKRRELRNLTWTSVGLMEQAFPGIGQLGFDYGIDRNGRAWIFEVNTRPH